METTLSLDSLKEAYCVLETRCLFDSSSWVLEFISIVDSNCQVSLPVMNISFVISRNLFMKGEFKKAAFSLKNHQDQLSLGLRMLSMLLQTQRQVEQNLPADTSFICNLPVIATHNFDNFRECLGDFEVFSEQFDPINQYLYGALLTKCGYYDRALPYIIRSLNGFPINYSAWKLLLSVLIRFDDSIISPSVTALPKHWCTKVFQISLLSELQQTEAAIRMFSEIKLPRTPSIIALEATIHYHHRNFDQACSLFQELRTSDPLRLESLELYSNLLFVLEDLATLSELAQSLSQIDKYRPETLSVAGNYYALNQKHEEAIEQFSMALRFDSQFTFAWTLIGHEYVEIENITAATAAYTKAYEANPRDFRALYGLGRAYEISKMPYHAILFYKNAVTMNPFDSRLWMALGECYEELSETGNAIKCYQRAVCNSDNEGSSLIRLGKLYKNEGDIDRAAFCYESYYNKKYFGKPDIDGEQKEEEFESIQFLSHYYFGKSNFVKSEQFAQVLLSDTGYVAEGNAILKDIRSKQQN